MSSRVPDLLTDYPSFIPDQADGVVVYDASADVTKATLLSNLVPTGINGMLFKALSSNVSGTDVATAQPWFPSAGAVAVEASKAYIFEGYLRTSRSAGTTSHTTSLLFAGTATLTSIAYRAIVNTGDTAANIAANQTAAEVATATVVKAASTSATEQIACWVRGVVRINGAGTFIPQFQYSSAPGGAPSVLSNTMFTLYPIGSGSVTTSGTWS